MVINESLRLYPPVTVMAREALRDVKFKEINTPKGVCIWTLALTLHTDPEVWGADAYQFNPERFANGVNGACKLPHFYMPFGIGPRVCLGQNLAMVEMKILISFILSISVSLSHLHISIPRLCTWSWSLNMELICMRRSFELYVINSLLLVSYPENL